MNAERTAHPAPDGSRPPPDIAAPPPSSRSDRVSTLLHWVLALVIGIEIAIGAYLLAEPRGASDWQILFSYHIVVGIAAAVLAVILLFWRLFHPAPEWAVGIRPWQHAIDWSTNALIYALLIVTPVTGYLASIFGDQSAIGPLVPLPSWAREDRSLNETFTHLHQGAALVLAALVVLHIGVVIAISLTKPGWRSRQLAPGQSPPSRSGATAEHGTTRESRRLARHFRVFGWVAFWVQLALGLICVLLLAVAASSTQFAAKSNVIPPGVLGAYAGILMLGISFLSFFYCTRLAKAILAHSTHILSRTRLLAMLGLLNASGFVGMSFALMGAGSSIALLIAKTVSQPPGIAITDPSKIIRALDVFILLANFDIIVAHFAGIVFSLWLAGYTYRHYRPSVPIKTSGPAPQDEASPPALAADPTEAPAETEHEVADTGTTADRPAKRKPDGET